MKRREIIKQGSLAALILALPTPLPSFKKYNAMNNKQDFDVIIIGGSYAGLSAAMALGRSLRNVLIIDSGLPCNRQTPHSHNFITQDGKTPSEIATAAKSQVLEYDTVQFLEDLASSGKRIAHGFEVLTASGKKVTAKKLVFATGIKDIMPEIKGFADCWGISVVH
ncbi:MAG: NAD(P)/FAD-dependent oxidoreductase, partial [Bacteroidota bacterium]